MTRSSTWLASILLLLALAPIGRAEIPHNAPAATAKPAIAALGGEGARPVSGAWEDADLGAMVQPGESFRSTTMVTAAYAFIWLVVLAFVTSVWMRGRAVEGEMSELERRIAAREQPSDGGGIGTR